MAPDDHRHGTNAGYQAHRKDGEAPCAACSDGRFRERKRIDLEVSRGARTLYEGHEVLTLTAPWTAMGLTTTAIAVAAGMEEQRGGYRLSGARPVLRATYHRLTGITEDDFHPNATVYADLTRTRIYSLMAAGHLQIDLPVNPRGVWRTRRHIRVGMARTVRDFYRAHEHTPGTSSRTANMARNAGHQPPAAWDDPDTLAWPLGWTVPVPLVDNDVDEVVVARVLAGHRIPCTPAERAAVLARAHDVGRSYNSLARQMGWNYTRDLKGAAA